MEIVISLIILSIIIMFIIKFIKNKYNLRNKQSIEIIILFKKYKRIIELTEEIDPLKKLFMELLNQTTEIGIFGKRNFKINRKFQEEAIELLGMIREKLIKLTPAHTK